MARLAGPQGLADKPVPQEFVDLLHPLLGLEGRLVEQKVIEIKGHVGQVLGDGFGGEAL